MRYVTSTVLAVVLEFLILIGLVGMFNSAPANLVTSPEMISIRLKATTVPVSVKNTTANLTRKGKNAKGSSVPNLSSVDAKVLNALKSFKKSKPPKSVGNPKGNIAPLRVTKEKPGVVSSSVKFLKPAEINPVLSKTVNPQFVTANASFTKAYTFSQLMDLGIPNFQSIEGAMKRDYELELSKLPTEMAYTLGGIVKGIIEVQTNGSVKVQRILSSPSVILTDIYVRNLEKFVTFPRSFALQDLEIDAIFDPSSGKIK